MFQNKIKLNIIYFVFCFILASVFFILTEKVIAAVSPNFQLQIMTNCGNNVKEPGESCDGTDLNSFDCSAFGFDRGTLACTPLCHFDTTACIKNSGGGSYTYTEPITNVLFEGRAYPNSVVTLLKDAQIVGTTVANNQANFTFNLSDISGGNYTFAVYSEDNQGNRSPLLTFPGVVTAGASNRISGIYIGPTIVLDKTNVKQGNSILISGQSYPNSMVSIYVDPIAGIVKDIQTKEDGKYSYNYNTSLLIIGTNFVKSKSAINSDSSSYSKIISLLVGDTNILSNPNNVALKGDLNNDGKVNLIDFSIAAYWYKRPTTTAFDVVENKRLNGDEKIDLVDFSIMAFYWTG